ncbi:MAG: response regulator [Symploca sp. SIO2G7]|nr:response regulator [Symploca sp. SIO2G7]
MNQSKGTILVVDDTPANVRFLVGTLTEVGYDVRPAIDSQPALVGAFKEPPDLILLDIQMPNMNGYEVCSKLKADERTKDIPVIFISALNEVLDKVKAFGVGGVDYITKPFQVEEVLARVETHLSLRSLQKHLEDKNEKLTSTLQQLKDTQNELIQQEKMAALGQLIAGVAHEINTPLGAIRSSARNIAKFLDQTLEQLPTLFQSLSTEESASFFALLQSSLQYQSTFSTREERKFKRALRRQLESLEIDNADIIADRLVIMGVTDEIDSFVPLLTRPDNLQILEVAYKLSALKRGTATINTSTDRASKVVFALKSYAHYDQSGAKVIVNLTDGIETVLTLYQNQIKQGVKVSKNYGKIPVIPCYPDELNQVWTNLIHNALQAMDNRGTLTIDVTQVDQQVKISITDSGCGIPEEIKLKIFKPFFTTKPLGEGSGLGLDIVKKIIDKHSGQITVESQPGQTTFHVFIPIDPV